MTHDKLTNVLLIEDDEDDYIITRNMLVHKPFQLVWKNTFSDALKYLRETTPDIVLLDLSLLESNGDNALDSVFLYTKQLPVVVLTGMEDEKVVAEALQRGAQDYLMKSQITAELIERSLRYSIMRKQTENDARKIFLLEQRADFAAMLAHDLKNPLLGAARILEIFHEGGLGDLTDEQKNVIEQLKTSNSRVLGMIANFLDAYRFESGAVVSIVSFSPTDVGALVQSCLKAVAPLIQKKELRVNVEIQEGLPTIQAERESLYRVIQNLLDNAIKFTHDEGTITVRLFHSGGATVFEIQNDGPIISMEDQVGLFERFWQGSGGKRSSGSGLGLYLCKHIVEAHNGQIICTSDEQTGTTFTVKLPLNENSVSPLKTGTSGGKF